MSDELLTIADLDVDGALEEAADRVDPATSSTRADLFRKAGIGGGALILGGIALGGLPALALGAPSKRQDIAILNYALTLEYLEAAFYRQALHARALSGPTRNFAVVAGGHERAHVAAIRRVLGSAAVAEPRFDFKNTVTDQRRFQRTAVVVEDLGVAAYAGQGPRLKQPAVIRAALSIHSVEARHAAWIRNIAGLNPSPAAFDPARSMAQVLTAVGATGFIVD